jgi:hypothetical protein
MTFYRGVRFAEIFAVCAELLMAQGVPAAGQLQAQQAQVQDIRSAATKAATDWSATRNCPLPSNGTQVAAEKMIKLAPTVSTRRSKCHLETDRQNQVVTALTTAYLDSLSKQASSPPESCGLTLKSIQSTEFPVIFGDPDSGFLEIDGSQDKADIYIDGSRKGSIKQVFVLSSGKHTWRTMKCEESIEIAPNDSRKVYCSTK